MRRFYRVPIVYVLIKQLEEKITIFHLTALIIAEWRVNVGCSVNRTMEHTYGQPGFPMSVVY